MPPEWRHFFFEVVMTYPEAINLPFNFSSIKDIFTLSPQPIVDSSEPGYWCIIRGNSLLMTAGEGRLSLPEGSLPEWVTPRFPAISIGRLLGKPLRAFSVSSSLEIHAPFVAEALNATEEKLDIRELTLGGLAKQILHWDNMHRHCFRCGAGVISADKTWGRTCTACGMEHFPSIHPCAIVLVRRDNELLLTRKAGWIPGRYSLVAGFLDFGESLEECACREVAEETGIEICNIQYLGSQNWPFPSQLMAGFIADYAGGEIRVDRNELEDAQWFKTDSLPSLPPKRSIARWIIDRTISNLTSQP